MQLLQSMVVLYSHVWYWIYVWMDVTTNSTMLRFYILHFTCSLPTMSKQVNRVLHFTFYKCHSMSTQVNMDFTFYKCTNATHFLPAMSDKVRSRGLYFTNATQQGFLHFTFQKCHSMSMSKQVNMDFTFYKCTNATHFLPAISDKVKGVLCRSMSMSKQVIMEFTFYKCHSFPPSNVR